MRIAATIALLTALAMTSAGLLVYLLDEARIKDGLNQRIDQEIAEFRKLQNGVDPRTNQPFERVSRLLRLYLQRNVTDDDEMLFTYLDGQPFKSSINQTGAAIADDPAFDAAVARLNADGGGTEIIDSARYDQVWLTLVPVTNEREPADTGALVIVNFADDELSELRRTIRTYAVVTVGFLGLITLISMWRAGQLLAPLTTLRRTAETIGATDLSLRIPERGNDDLTALTRTLNAMLARLEDAFVGQRQFLDDAGHELRTPLTILQGHLELLDAQDPAEVEETRALLLDEVDRMSRLVGDLILLAKHDRPDFLTPAPVSVERLTHTLHAKTLAMADRDWHLAQVGEGIAQLDEQRVTQAVLQLVDNAIKHTRDGERISLGSAVEAGVVRLWVADVGPGVPDALKGHIFERFGRGHVSDDDEGFGLGLSIVRAIAEAHGGWVDVADHSPGDPRPGAVFTLHLPQEQPWPES